jgi:hypothetical protein
MLQAGPIQRSCPLGDLKSSLTSDPAEFDEAEFEDAS